MNQKMDLLESDKNLHARIPAALLAKLEETAQEEHTTVDELVQKAVEGHIYKKDNWQELVAFGVKHAKSRGLKPSDVPREIAKLRRENQERSQ